MWTAVIPASVRLDSVAGVDPAKVRLTRYPHIANRGS